MKVLDISDRRVSIIPWTIFLIEIWHSSPIPTQSKMFFTKVSFKSTMSHLQNHIEYVDESEWLAITIQISTSVFGHTFHIYLILLVHMDRKPEGIARHEYRRFKYRRKQLSRYTTTLHNRTIDTHCLYAAPCSKSPPFAEITYRKSENLNDSCTHYTIANVLTITSVLSSEKILLWSLI